MHGRFYGASHRLVAITIDNIETDYLPSHNLSHTNDTHGIRAGACRHGPIAPYSLRDGKLVRGHRRRIIRGQASILGFNLLSSSRGLRLAAQALILLPLASNVFLAFFLGLYALPFLVLFFAFFALSFIALFLLALSLLLLANFFESFFFYQRIEPTLLFLCLTP